MPSRVWLVPICFFLHSHCEDGGIHHWGAVPEFEKAKDEDGRKKEEVGETISRMTLKLHSWEELKNKLNKGM
jgi:hypothetical protein